MQKVVLHSNFNSAKEMPNLSILKFQVHRILSKQTFTNLNFHFMVQDVLKPYLQGLGMSNGNLDNGFLVLEICGYLILNK